MSNVPEQQPDGFSHAPRKVRDRAIGHDDQIKMLKSRGRVGKIANKGRKIEDGPPSRQRTQFLLRWPLLQAEQLNAGQSKRLKKLQQRLSSLLVALERHAPRPHDPDFQAGRRPIYQFVKPSHTIDWSPDERRARNR